MGTAANESGQKAGAMTGVSTTAAASAPRAG